MFPNPVPRGTPTVHILDVSLIWPIYLLSWSVVKYIFFITWPLLLHMLLQIIWNVWIFNLKHSSVHLWHIRPLASDHHGLLIIPIHWLASSLGLLSTSKLVCGECSGALWLLSHHLGGCCTLVVDEEIPPFYVKCFEYPEKRYLNVRNYYYYYYYERCRLSNMHTC